MKNALRILFVEDSEDDAKLLLMELERTFEIASLRVQTSNDMKRALRDDEWDVIVSDFSLPGFSGFAALEMVKAEGLDIPFIIVSGKIGEDRAVDAMKRGAHDFIVKERLSRLNPAIEREIREAAIRRQQTETAAQLKLEKQRLEDVTLHANCGLLLLDGEGRILYSNRIMKSWFEPLNSIEGQVSWTAFQLDSPDEQSAAFRSLRTGQPAKGKIFSRQIDGATRYFQFSATPVHDERGQIRQITEVVVDTTERVLIEQAQRVRESEIRKIYVDVFHAVSGGKLVIMTKDEVNRSMGQLVAEPLRINRAEELANARSWLRAVISSACPDLPEVNSFIIAIGEGMTNAVKHAGQGQIEVYESDSAVQVMISDKGGGIDFATLPKATLLAGFSTKVSLGFGFTIMLEIADRIFLATDDTGTKLALGREKIPAPRFPLIST